ncbi:hypothetical protein SAMN05216312_1239 [Cohnella sp. OV330]|uniref:PIN-like domain-containing protein n=1 Tax=Cohnella sp. OV330 TaxID=1855288 RepID=UPI0008F1E10B|nr:PIN domain-containing protein [Cohnella sp. OV330]SFB62820.1 hypothetical protein SAMN05216312_1239 [Cohnella sp. OV330]
MKQLFSTYFSPTDDEYKELWQKCIFVFDANVLLNLYRYSNNTTDIFLDIITRLSERIWVPHQVALEYNANRIGVIYEQLDAYARVRQIISKASVDFFNHLEENLKSYKRRHPVIDVSTITSRLDGFIKSINGELEKQEESHPNYLQSDSIRSRLEVLLENKIGLPFNENELQSIYDEGDKRYKQKRPPGFRDSADKKDKVKYYRGLVIQDQYGDLIVWKQILNKAKDEQVPVIFITDDAKDDWWQRQHGKTIGPRMELVDEFSHYTDQKFLMYESYRFIEYAQGFLNQQVDKEAINEAHQLKRSKEVDTNHEMMNEVYQYNKLLKSGKLNSRIVKPIVNYTVGEKVIHAKWGVGIIESIHGSGKNQEIRINFPQPAGKKRLLAYFAPLQKFTPFDDNDDLEEAIYELYDEEFLEELTSVAEVDDYEDE